MLRILKHRVQGDSLYKKNMYVKISPAPSPTNLKLILLPNVCIISNFQLKLQEFSVLSPMKKYLQLTS